METTTPWPGKFVHIEGEQAQHVTGLRENWIAQQPSLVDTNVPLLEAAGHSSLLTVKRPFSA